MTAPRVAAVPDAVRDTMVALRRELHRHPELSLHEERTAERLHAALEALHPVALDRVGGTGLVARIRGRDGGAPAVAVRGDIDALPIQEATGLPFASDTPGVMHACGHDAHAAWTVGAAHLLAEHPAAGDVLFVLQPAEEIGRGALAILDSGALDDVRVIYGAHVDRRFAVGQVVAQEGPVGAASDEFRIVLVGQGAHGARPHEAADPVAGSGTLIVALQTIVARRVDPARPAVLSIGEIHGGSAPNVIPGRVEVAGTLRSTEPATRQVLADSVREVAAGVAAAHGIRAEVQIVLGTPPVVNDARAAAWARAAAERVLGPAGVVPLGTVNMGAEDFAFYMERMPGTFLRIGAREAGGARIPAHSPGFYADEGCLPVGAAVLAECARTASGALSAER